MFLPHRYSCRLFVLLLLTGLANANLLAQDNQAERDRKQVTQEIPGSERLIYKSVGDVDLPLFVFRPDSWQASDQRPAIVFFFGGGWRSGSPTQFAPQAEYLASRGMVAICVEYRVHSRQGATVADCVRDARSAMRWVRSHASELGIDPNRIAVGGGSAGGHLAAAVALLPGFDDPQDDPAVSCVPAAMVLFNPAVDISPEGLGREPDSERAGELTRRLGGELAELSPAGHVRPGLPACIIFHGEEDPTVPFAQEVAFRDAMTEAGNRCELVGYPGYKHGFFNFNRQDKHPYYDTLRRTDEFLASLGYLEGPPRVKESDGDQDSK